MLTHPTLDKLQALKLAGMSQALVEQRQLADIAALSCEERCGLLGCCAQQARASGEAAEWALEKRIPAAPPRG